MPREWRLLLPGMDERRVDLLPAGALVLATTASELGARAVMVSEWGLREGAILDALGLADLASPEPAALRRRSIDRACRGWSVDEAHGRVIAHVALSLFDGTEELHGMGPADRELLEHAARVHDIGVRISPDRHHRHGAYLIEHAGLRGFSPEEVAMIASLVRFQRGEPKTNYEPFAALRSRVQDRVVTLVALLRVAHGLARAHRDAPPGIVVAESRGRVRISVSGVRDAESVAAEGRAHSGLLQEVLGRPVEVRAEAPAAASA
jgi:exopolyphosphatase/guanosine-5'-triphosphate,3'-diphosphate pyrophosphatase